MKPKGWSIDNRHPTKPYSGRLMINGVSTYLGHFATEEEAHEEYLKAREANPLLPKTNGRKGVGKWG